ncbi:MAG: hypothetical protein ACFBSD_07595 [Paracoccaceae bacterium]
MRPDRAHLTTRRGAGWLTVACVVAACTGSNDSTPVPIEERTTSPLTAAEARIFLRDSTLSQAGEDMVRHVYLRDDGSMTGLAINPKDKGRLRVEGRWIVAEDGRFCPVWDGPWIEGATGCAMVFRYGDDYVFAFTEGEEPVDIRRTRVAGNAQKL